MKTLKLLITGIRSILIYDTVIPLNQDVVIVSRDTDYGCRHAGSMLINDWLAQEFKERVNRRKKVILTDKLTEGFKLADISVGKKEVEDENEFLTTQLLIRSKKATEQIKLRTQRVEEILKELLGDNTE